MKASPQDLLKRAQIPPVTRGDQKGTNIITPAHGHICPPPIFSDINPGVMNHLIDEAKYGTPAPNIRMAAVVVFQILFMFTPKTVNLT